MELQHKQNQQDDSTINVSAAVDLKQFQNTQVGIGYQAKHVIRQRTATTGTATNDLKSKKKITMMHDNSNGVDSVQVVTVTGKEEFLRNNGLRMFRKEIENILSTPA